ncbi:DNA polymerase III subunit delta [Hutsoniella sourekii]
MTNIQKEIQKLKQGHLAPVYYIYGSEVFLKHQFNESLLAVFDDEPDLVQLDLSESSVDDILDEANLFSFFAEYRVIMVENADFLTSQPKNKLTPNQEKRLIDYIEFPNQQSVLVFYCSQDQLDKRRKIVKAFVKETIMIDISPLQAADVERYVHQTIEDTHLQITREAQRELLERVNYQLSEAMNELVKLRSYSTLGKPINIEVVRSLVPRTLESDVFELTNALLTKQVERTVQIYQDLILMRNDPVQLHALLTSQFRVMIQSKILSSMGFNQGQIASELSIHPYRVKLALENSKMMTLAELKIIYQEIVAVDYAMKTGYGDPQTHFIVLLTKIVQNKKV